MPTEVDVEPFMLLVLALADLNLGTKGLLMTWTMNGYPDNLQFGGVKYDLWFRLVSANYDRFKKDGVAGDTI